MAEPLNRWRRGGNRSTRRKPLATSFSLGRCLKARPLRPQNSLGRCPTARPLRPQNWPSWCRWGRWHYAWCTAGPLVQVRAHHPVSASPAAPLHSGWTSMSCYTETGFIKSMDISMSFIWDFDLLLFHDKMSTLADENSDISGYTLFQHILQHILFTIRQSSIKWYLKFSFSHKKNFI